MKIIFSAVFVNEEELMGKYPQKLPNAFYHHSTIEFRPKTIEGLSVGQEWELKITGRITTNRVDVLLVDNPLSTNPYPHITLSTAEGVKPFQSNSEILGNLNEIETLNDSITGVVGFFDGINNITNMDGIINECKNRFYQILN